ncbi:MAG: hypothetical protein IPM68_02430 [Flavobacteriales bacterium]|nr:hypothetical protein [Flavobacteriales bacterium]
MLVNVLAFRAITVHHYLILGVPDTFLIGVEHKLTLIGTDHRNAPLKLGTDVHHRRWVGHEVQARSDVVKPHGILVLRATCKRELDEQAK